MNAWRVRENDVEAAIKPFLEYRGWRVQRMQSGLFQRPGAARARITVGEKGMADWQCLRPRPDLGSFVVDHFYLETKAPGKRLRPEQRSWTEELRRRSFEVWVFDDFRAFERWYFSKWPRERRQRL